MPFHHQQGALELTETITKPNTSLCQGKASIKTEFTANLSVQSEHRHKGSILIPKALEIINENTPYGYTT